MCLPQIRYLNWHWTYGGARPRKVGLQFGIT